MEITVNILVVHGNNRVDITESASTLSSVPIDDLRTTASLAVRRAIAALEGHRAP
jgi:hypothetical protein